MGAIGEESQGSFTREVGPGRCLGNGEELGEAVEGEGEGDERPVEGSGADVGVADGRAVRACDGEDGVPRGRGAGGEGGGAEDESGGEGAGGSGAEKVSAGVLGRSTRRGVGS